jgi:hypothetical protein
MPVVAGSVRILTVLVALVAPIWVVDGDVRAQSLERQQGLPDPIPPPTPKAPPPEHAGNYRSIIPPSDDPWVLEGEVLEALFHKAAIYREYTRRFDCTETARLADYNGRGEVSGEQVRQYGYLLVKSPSADAVAEYRQLVTKTGEVRSGEVKDEEPFPPAYAWVFLFSRFNEPYFSLRYVGERFDGFDWVHEIQFRGSLPFTNGKDIRQWEGIVLIDAVTHTPLEIRAEPLGQADRIDAMYRQWSSSFNMLGMRTGAKPLGYRAHIQFRHKQEGLSFPTELRYDTFRAVSPTQIVPHRASTRVYDKYRIFRSTATPETPATDGATPPPQ